MFFQASKNSTGVERAARELSQDSTWILVQSSSSVQVVGTALSFGMGSVGEGEFTMEEDRQKLAPVMKSILMCKLLQCLRDGDLPAFRRYLNMQSVHLRGLDIEPVGGLLPVIYTDAAADFLHQNGLARVEKSDKAGWWPLHYAALSGKAEVIQGLLQMRAAVNQRTSRDEPMLGIPPWVSALDLAVFCKNNEAAQLLISSGAHLKGGVLPAINHVAVSDNAEGIRLLRAAGSSPQDRDLMGGSALQGAAGCGSVAVVEELAVQGETDSLELSVALHYAALLRGGSAELVHRLIELRADVNFQLNMRRELKPLGRLLFGLKSLQHRRGRKSALSTVAYHLHGSTPLMVAVLTAQYEAAAALIAAGAKLDMRNCRNWTAADFARGAAIPPFLQQGLAGDPSECRRVASMAGG